VRDACARRVACTHCRIIARNSLFGTGAASVQLLRGLTSSVRNRLYVSVPDEAMFIDADPTRLEQVIGNSIRALAALDGCSMLHKLSRCACLTVRDREFR
jgi:C4-dicarboxylate-specific signal transduction histidine kinase